MKAKFLSLVVALAGCAAVLPAYAHAAHGPTYNQDDFKSGWGGNNDGSHRYGSHDPVYPGSFKNRYDRGFGSTAPKPAAAPEIDPASAAAALTLLAGGLATLRGRRRKA